MSRGGPGGRDDGRGDGRSGAVRSKAGLATGTALALAGLLLAGCSSGSGAGGDKAGNGGGDKAGDAGSESIAQRPKAVTPYWVDPESNAAKQVATYAKGGKEKQASLMRKVASQPMAHWIGGDDPEGLARKTTTAAAKADREALLSLSNLPYRDCGNFSKGFANTAGGYRAWLAKVVKGIGKRPATVILEPGALGQMLAEKGCVTGKRADERLRLLRAAVGELKKLADVRVYLDVGHPERVRDPRKLVEPMKQSGIADADGFSLNATNYQTTASNMAYGKKISRSVGDKHFVIDTGRNGNGPVKNPGKDKEPWCNQKGRALGAAPTSKTGDELVDDYLWIKPPGESDGPCKGGPEAGKWWPEYALGLAQNAR